LYFSGTIDVKFFNDHALIYRDDILRVLLASEVLAGPTGGST